MSMVENKSEQEIRSTLNRLGLVVELADAGLHDFIIPENFPDVPEAHLIIQRARAFSK